MSSVVGASACPQGHYRGLFLPAVVDHMIGGEGPWNAVASFCKQVMSQKDAAERKREADPLAARRVASRGRPTGGRWPPVRGRRRDGGGKTN